MHRRRIFDAELLCEDGKLNETRMDIL